MDSPFAWIVVAYAALIIVVLAKWWSDVETLRRIDRKQKPRAEAALEKKVSISEK